MKKNKQMSINLISQIMSFIINLGISFFLTRYIVATIGAEVYGFSSLATTLTSYISVITIALNGMLNRYVTIEYQRKNYELASRYLSTVIIANTVISCIIAIPFTLVCLKVDYFFNISQMYVFDVKILWAFIFGFFLFKIPTGPLAVSTFAKNRLDLDAVRTVQSNIIKAILLIGLFAIMQPHVYYIGIATAVSGFFIIFYNYRYYKKLTPELSIKVKLFRKDIVKELVGIGIWNSINRLQDLLMTGLDLILTNIYIGSYEMSMFSIAKTCPLQLSMLISTVTSIFDPIMTISYAKDSKSSFIKETKFAMKINGFICSVPIMALMILGSSFYGLWQPTLPKQDIQLIYVLSVLTLLPSTITVFIHPLYQVNTITCKLKIPVLLNVGIGLSNIAIVFSLLHLSNIGIYAIAGVSSVLSIIRVLIFTPIYAAYVLKLPWYTFYDELLKGIVSIVFMGGVFYFIQLLVNPENWITFLFTCILVVVMGYSLNFCILLSKNDRSRIMDMLMSKLKGKSA